MSPSWRDKFHDPAESALQPFRNRVVSRRHRLWPCRAGLRSGEETFPGRGAGMHQHSDGVVGLFRGKIRNVREGSAGRPVDGCPGRSSPDPQGAVISRRCILQCSGSSWSRDETVVYRRMSGEHVDRGNRAPLRSSGLVRNRTIIGSPGCEMLFKNRCVVRAVGKPHLEGGPPGDDRSLS